MPQLHVGLVYGGQSAEHDVSVLSARNVLAALGDRHRVTPLYIDRDGRWWAQDPAALADAAGGAGADADRPPGDPVSFAPGAGSGTVIANEKNLGLDVLIPMLHGQNGEDGVVQGFVQALGLPYVGPGVLASAACMDKVTAKRLLTAAGIPNTPYAVVEAHRRDHASFDAVAAELGAPVFVKPSNSGSSVGVSRVATAAEFGPALDLAFRYDRLALVERAIVGREIEVAVLGNETPQASVPGEIVMTSAFYDYESKYESADASRMEVPADLAPATAERLRGLAVEAYAALGCEGLARVDFFLTDDGAILVNELNTIPGFTARSMYPVMWAETGRPPERLVDDLIDLALARHRRDAARSMAR